MSRDGSMTMICSISLESRYLLGDSTNLLETPYLADDSGTVRREALHRLHHVGECNRWSVIRISSLLQTCWVTESVPPVSGSAVAHVECASTLYLSFASCWQSGFRSFASLNASFSVTSPLGRWTYATSPGLVVAHHPSQSSG